MKEQSIEEPTNQAHSQPIVEIGDTVRDPLDGSWRTVSQIAGEWVFLADGGAMPLRECTDILLPSEPIPTD